MNIKTLICLTFASIFWFVSSISFAAEPTTLPGTKEKPKEYPGNIWKPDPKQEKPKEYPGNVWEPDPKQYPGNIWKPDPKQ